MKEQNNQSLVTPYFLIDKEQLDEGLNKLKRALATFWPNYVIGHSYKTNALPWVIEYFKEHESYAEVVSDDEYLLAKSIGVENSRIIYNGVAKSKETFLEAVRNHAVVNIDSEQEIEWLAELERDQYEVGIRINFDIEKMRPGQTHCGEEGSRFGFCYENGELKRAIDRIEAFGVRVRGIHLHKSSITRMPNIYEAIAEMAVEISKRYNLNLKYVDIGGGFFGGLKTKPPFTEYIEKVRNILIERFSPFETTLIVEPGMAIIGAPISYVTSVLDIKKTTQSTFLITDGSRTQIDPLMRKTSYFYDIVRQPDRERRMVEKQIVSGYTCMEDDRLFRLENSEELLLGDQIIYHKVGAYTMCLSPLFIKWFPDVYVKDNAKIFKVRKRWTEKEYRSGSIKK